MGNSASGTAVQTGEENPGASILSDKATTSSSSSTTEHNERNSALSAGNSLFKEPGDCAHVTALPRQAFSPFSEPNKPTAFAKVPRRKKSRCGYESCRRRVSITNSFCKCRCGRVFCRLHRFSMNHACEYDFKASARRAICEANPVVKAEKVRKI